MGWDWQCCSAPFDRDSQTANHQFDRRFNDLLIQVLLLHALGAAVNALTRTNKYANDVVMVDAEWHKQLAELDGLVKSLILLW